MKAEHDPLVEHEWELLLRKDEVRIIRTPHNGSGVERRANSGAVL
jgi:hypothetical protein